MKESPGPAPLHVLARNRLVTALALLLTGGGVVSLAALAAGVFANGSFGFHALLVAALFGYALAFRNFAPRKIPARVETHGEGIAVDGELRVPRAAIAEAYFQPRPAASTGRSTLRVEGRFHQILFETEVEHEGHALVLLKGLGLDAASRRASFDGASSLGARARIQTVAGFFIAMFVLGLMRGLRFPPEILPLLAIPVALLFAVPSRIVVGIDGLLVTWLWQKRFIPMSDIRSVLPDRDRTIRILRNDGTEETLYTSGARKHRSWSESAERHRDAVYARIHEALYAFRESAAVAEITGLLRRGERPVPAWVALLRQLRAKEGGYRDVAVRADDLWHVLEDPSAPAGAAFILRHGLDNPGKARVRVAAEATASPKLRVALEAAFGTEDEAEAEEALSELAAEERAS
jgi:hypothetical protein